MESWFLCVGYAGRVLRSSEHSVCVGVLIDHMLSAVRLFGNASKELCCKHRLHDQSAPQASEDYEGEVQEFILSLNDQLLKLVLCDQKEVHPGGHDSEPCKRSGIRIHIPEVLHETVIE